MLKPSPLIIFLNDLKDPRARSNACEHKFIDILIIAICAIMSGAETWEDIESYGHDKKDWLCTFLELPHGIPSHDCFYRIFCVLDPEALEVCFIRWVKSYFPMALPLGESQTDIVPIDGKTIRGSRGKGKRAVHMVSAWSSRLRLVLGQKKVDTKSNEITAVPELFEIIDLKGALVTADAISCQKSIAAKCIEKEADYLLAVKGNQETLQNDIQAVVESHWEQNPVDQPCDNFAEQRNTGHGRHEYRCCWVFNDLTLLSTHTEWEGLKQFGVVQADRTIDGKATTALRLYITSKAMTAEEMLTATRIHWEVENNVHWMLDIAFNEDACLTQDKNASENLSVLRRICLNIFNMDTANKGSMKRKRKRAGWNNGYLAGLLNLYIFGEDSGSNANDYPRA